MLSLATSGPLLEILLALLVLAGFTQRNGYRLNIGVMFVGLVSTHYLLDDWVKLEGLWYYGSAALFDLAFIGATVSFSDSKLLDSLCNISIVSMLLNFFGWLLWFNYYPPAHYDLAFLCLYTWAVVVLLRKDIEYVGGYGVGGGGVTVHKYNFTRYNRNRPAEA